MNHSVAPLICVRSFGRHDWLLADARKVTSLAPLTALTPTSQSVSAAFEMVMVKESRTPWLLRSAKETGVPRTVTPLSFRPRAIAPSSEAPNAAPLNRCQEFQSTRWLLTDAQIVVLLASLTAPTPTSHSDSGSICKWLWLNKSFLRKVSCNCGPVAMPVRKWPGQCAKIWPANVTRNRLTESRKFP